MAISTRRVVRKRHRAPGLVERSACQLLRQLARQVPADQTIVELGAFKGRSTGWLLLGAQEGHGAHVHTVDPWALRTGERYVGGSRRFPRAYREFKTHMAGIGATSDHLSVHRGFAAAVAASWSGPPVGLLWHDAGHGEQEVADDLQAWLPHMAQPATIVLHDACRAEYGVPQGAQRALADQPDWDWPGREIVPWRRRPHRRGVMIVRRRQ